MLIQTISNHFLDNMSHDTKIQFLYTLLNSICYNNFGEIDVDGKPVFLYEIDINYDKEYNYTIKVVISDLLWDKEMLEFVLEEFKNGVAEIFENYNRFSNFGKKYSCKVKFFINTPLNIE